MAIQKDTEFIGKIGNLIYYKWMDLYCIRTAPASVRQTEATKNAAIIFGKVSSRSKMLRQHLNRYIAAPRDKEMQQRLKRALRESIKPSEPDTGDSRNHPLLNFPFNEALRLEQCLGFKPRITMLSEGNMILEIPAVNPVSVVKAPAGTSKLQLEVLALSFSFEHENAFGGTPATFNLTYTDAMQPAMTASLETDFEKPCLLLVCAALSYWNGEAQLNPPGYNPAEVIAIFDLED